ncbi:hypothetical protein N7537_010756 [Penicillium hordei]|uniref:Protein efr3 n=1 Tax=Penicillium hordei TaxID=40994 RepID=A0AAD6DKG9_9EURO|nr:uncharacterized protein N7537_010756 [Penicillium hordei]KAJ5588078.1 hypothetical protein N7537_010756 [Penicillium hordei]
MESVRQSCRPKHQVLTLKCYPKYQKGVSEVRPNPSELSYLLYYTSTRRSKLTKVGGFLEKRVARDVWRRRIGNVQVALHILAALIEKVPRDLPIYARSVMTVIDTVLRSNDVNMVEESIVTFEMFCRHQDIAAVAADQGLAQQYREVVRTYTSLADPEFTSNSNAALSPQVAIRWRNAGLRAIRAVVSSETLAADGGVSLKLCLPVVLKNLYSDDEDLLTTLKAKLTESDPTEREGPKPRRMSINTVHTVDTAEGDPELAAQSAAEADRKAELDARLLALRCLEQTIVSGSNRGQIRIAVTVILQFIASKGFPQSEKRVETIEGKSGNWATSLIELIANWCPVQVRFIILITAMEILHDTSPKEDALESSFTILSVVDWLLRSSVNMIGLSVMDILFGLMHYASDILSPPERTGSAESEKKSNRQIDTVVQISPRRQDLLTLLEQCIGDLATHIYYGDQIADMMRAILRRFKPNLHHDSSAPSTLATVHESGVAHDGSTNSGSETNVDKASTESFSHAAAKLTALRAVKAILIVANSRTPETMPGAESRQPVGIHVWEGTQVLLRDPDRDVRYAYTDAFLSWLRIETNGNDLKVRLDSPKYIKTTTKRDTEQVDRPNRRGNSAPANQRDKVVLVAQSNFLRLLHLAIYDAALEVAAEEAEILLLHLLLANLVDNLGVNAAQFGVPMVLKLQDDLFTSMDPSYVAARVNLGSLVHGYLLALSEHFEMQSSPVGLEISNEIQERQGKGYWLSKIRLPPVDLYAIVFDSEKRSYNDSTSPPSLTPFRNVDGLVYLIEESYRKSVSSPPQSPSASSTARGFTFPVLGHPTATVKSQAESGLPSVVKEQMLSPWSREVCLAAVDKESTGASSINGSRATQNARNNQNQTNGATNGSPAGSQYPRCMSVPEISSSSSHGSSRGSPVRVDELRRVLSVTNDNHARRLSPLRGRLDASNASVISSGSDSMVSGNFSVSEIDGDATSIQPESQHTPEEDGTETPRASAAAFVLPGDNGPADESPSEPSRNRVDSNAEIPPVPPIPVGLSIPGGLPNDPQRSLGSYDRPYTAPGPSAVRDRAEASALNNKPLNRNKSRSNYSLATVGIPELLTDYESDALDGNHQDQLRKLLDGFLSPGETAPMNGNRPTTAKPASKAPLSGSNSRRQVSGGLGRPPY